MAVLGPSVSVNMNGHNSIQSQLTRSLERILEEAYLSGELKLSGRKLKEFPKPVKFDLCDTVLADLSKNRFSEVPDELTTYLYLERLLLSQNVISHVPDAVGGLQSLTYLDLSSNQLTEVPREICQMPLEVLLLSDNLLTSLPKEIGKMGTLAELDAATNRLTQVPMTIGDCTALKALDLSNNQLALLPLQITYLRLESLDISCNCISSLPLELRNMTSLITLNLENNPMVSPPTTVCMRGRVHIFKYLENMANKDIMPSHRRIDDTRRSTKHASYIGSTPNQSSAHQIMSGNATIDCLRHRNRHVVDSGYSTSDGGDKRWSNDGAGEAGGGGGVAEGGSGRSTPSTPSTLSPGAALSRAHSLSSESQLAPLTPLLSGLRISPDGNMSNGDDKTKLNHQQTYRQYKEALRQQRQQDVYRPRTDQSSPDLDSSPHSQNQSPVHMQSTPHSPVANGHYNRSVSSNSSISSSALTTPNTSQLPNSPLLHSTPRRFQSSVSPNQTNGNVVSDSVVYAKPDEVQNKRPVQKVVPSRNVNKMYAASPPINGNVDYQNGRVNGSPLRPDSEIYIKPMSPTKSPTMMMYNSIPPNNVRSNMPSRRDVLNGSGDPSSAKLLTTTVSYLKGASAKPPGGSGRLTWNKDMVPEKLSFTMKREFDKQKEELDLLQQLRVIIEGRLKMALPEELAPVLADGVVLCHLANHVRPRSVASVHVPSPAQPKLTMARCRRNVDNFLEACRKIGVEEEVICSPGDILMHHPDCAEGSLNTAPLAHTIAALLTHATSPQHSPKDFNSFNLSPQMNEPFVHFSNPETFDNQCYGAYYGESVEMQHSKSVGFKRDASTHHANFQNKHLHRTRYTEERLLSNFNPYANSECVQNYTIDESEELQMNFDNNNSHQVLSHNIQCNVPYDNDGLKNRMAYTYLNDEIIDRSKVHYVPLVYEKDGMLQSDNLEIYDTDEVDFSKHDDNPAIKGLRYERGKMNLEIQDNLNKQFDKPQEVPVVEDNRMLVTCLCLGTFFLTALLLILYPL